MKDFDLRKYLAENKLIKEEIMVDTTVMVDPNNTLMSNASDEEIDYIKTNITSVSEMSVENFKDIYDKYLNRFYDEADPLDLQIKALQIHIDKDALDREEAIEALAILQEQDPEDYEDEFSEEQMGSYGKFLEVVESYEDEEILSDFLDSYPKGQDISKSEYERFTEKHLGLSDPEDYRGKNWKYIMSENRLY